MVANDVEKSKLQLLLEALEREQGPHDSRAIRINCSEYSYDVARHAKECLTELRELLGKKEEAARG